MQGRGVQVTSCWMKRRLLLRAGAAAIAVNLPGYGGSDASAANDLVLGVDAINAEGRAKMGAPGWASAPALQLPVAVGAKTFEMDFNDSTRPLLQWDGGPFSPYSIYFGGDPQPEGEDGYRWWGDALSVWTTDRYTPAAYKSSTVANGALAMNVRRALPDYPNSPKPYLSASLETAKGGWWLDPAVRAAHRGFEQKYGYFECRAKIPKQQGLWPAFWLNGGMPQKNPTGRGELDIFEIVSTGGQIHQTGHDFWGPHTQESTAIVPGFDHSADFHIYALHWTPKTIVWFIDGKETKRASNALVAKYRDLCGPMFITLGIGAGNVGSWSGAPDHTTVLPATLSVDYVRAYALA